jgi:hypothetical protein
MSTTIFDIEFYPTPLNVVYKMLGKVADRKKNMTFLEPSAGSGNILEVVKNDSRFKKIYAIESNPDLVLTLQGKGYNVISNDFLTFEPTNTFDCIIMNPPFSNGDEHLLKAWDIIKGGCGDVVCLINAETIRNPYTKKRALLSTIIQQHGSVEYIGRPFADYGRKTNVEVAMVHLRSNNEDDIFKINFDGSKEETPDFKQFVEEGTDIATNDKVGAYLRSWKLAQESCLEYLKAKEKFEFYAKPFFGGSSLEYVEKNFSMSEQKDIKLHYNALIDECKRRAWETIIRQIGMDKFMTSNLRKSFDEFKSSQGAYELNRENIANLVSFICLNSNNIMKRAVVDLFKEFTSYDKKNTNHTEGWKTNSNYKVNKRVILPAFVECKWSNYYSYNSYRYSAYNDIDKVMCYLSGVSYDTMTAYPRNNYEKRLTEEEKQRVALISAVGEVQVGDNTWHESRFFRFRCFKKGTLHIEFKDEELWAKFNKAVNDGVSLGY